MTANKRNNLEVDFIGVSEFYLPNLFCYYNFTTISEYDPKFHIWSQTYVGRNLYTGIIT